MERNSEINLEIRKYTSRLIIERALERHWDVTGFSSNPALFLLGIPGRDDPVKIFSSSPPATSYAASKMAKDKFISNKLLSGVGLPVPAELLHTRHAEISDTDITDFLERYKKVVVKPLDTSHGNGITLNLTDIDSVKDALHVATEASQRHMALLQQQVDGYDVRIVCIGYEFADAITRIPASVIGDGTSSVGELIESANLSDERGENYKAKLNVIPVARAKKFLGDDGLARVPGDGEVVQVIGVSNIGTGGVRKNIKQDIPQFLKEYAILASRTMELPVCGVDFMVRRLPDTDSQPEDITPYVIEVNECPMLTMYDDLSSDEQAAVIDRFLDFVGRSKTVSSLRV